MRHVQVWVSCSFEGCECKAEHLVPLETGAIWNPDGSVDRRIGEALPDGWSWRSADSRHPPDAGDTFCPAHADPSAIPIPEKTTRDFSKHIGIAGLVVEVSKTITPEQIQALTGRLTQPQLIYLLQIVELARDLQKTPASG